MSIKLGKFVSGFFPSSLDYEPAEGKKVDEGEAICCGADYREVSGAELASGQGQAAPQILGIAAPTFSRPSHKYAGLTVEQGKSLQHFCD